MIEPALLEYTYDEEALGFGEPVTPEQVSPPGASAWTWVARGVVGVGLAALVMQILGHAWAGTWPGLALSLGLISFGAMLQSWAALKDTTPGIKHDGIFFDSLVSRGALGWLAGITMTGLYVLIYWFPEVLGERGVEGPVGLVRVVDPLAQWTQGDFASRWFLYGVLYSLAIGVFAVRMAMKYRHNRYHLIRTASVTVFQFVFAWTLPNLLVRFNKPYVEFNGVWPLKQDYLWPEKISGQFAGAGSFGTFLLVFAIGGVIATPILTYFYGKRWYCSWVCGCGGLAETLGDPFRQNSSKSTSSWHLERWMVHTVLVLVVVTTGMLWVDSSTTGNLYGSWSAPFREWYGFYIGMVFSGVVGVGFYPILGNRVWCRFGCPQAAILGLWQRAFSRFRITTNGGQCMSCGNCSTYCEMGIDVRAYAQSGDNTIRASCVGCGVCAAVCPRGVLRLENGETHADRFDGAEDPWKALTESLQRPDVYSYKSWPPESVSAGAPEPASSAGAGE